MAKGAYIGVDGKARKIKKGYIGVDGKARKIKKAYTGIGGVARPCWSGGELVYYGEITPLGNARRYLCSASNMNYAIFAGGSNNSVVTSVDTFDKALTKKKANTTITTEEDRGISNLGNYALFNDRITANVVAFDGSLTTTTTTPLQENRTGYATATIGDYGLFVGANYGADSYHRKLVDVYDKSLTKRSVSNLPYSNYAFSGASVGDYAVFNTVGYAYSKSLTRTSVTVSGNTATYSIGATTGNYAVFFGGQNSSQSSAFNASLTETIVSTALNASDMAGCDVGGFAIFSGGKRDGSWYSTVYCFDTSLTVKYFNLPARTAQHAATSIDNYALIGGGYDDTADSYTDRVVAFTVA